LERDYVGLAKGLEKKVIWPQRSDQNISGQDLEVVSLKCKNCGGNLAIDIDTDIVQCRYCKAQHQVRREPDGATHLAMLEAGVQQLIDKENAKLRIREIEKEKALLLEKAEEAGDRAREIAGDFNRGELIVGLIALLLGCSVLFKGGTHSIRLWGFLAGAPIGALLTWHALSRVFKLRAESAEYGKLKNDYLWRIRELEEEIVCLNRILDKPVDGHLKSTAED
jgi:hypothetical protein